MLHSRKAAEANESGALALVGNELSYVLANQPAWRLLVAKIRSIGEYTTSAGPFIDDYFLLFVDEEAHVYEASFYAQGRDEALASLSAHLHAPLQLRLANSTSWRSRVLWPPELVNQALFLVQRRPPRLLREYIWTWLCVPPESITLTPSILEHLQQHSARQK